MLLARISSSRLTRSTLILVPVFGIHYSLFVWNTKPVLIPHLILIHLTVHTIFSSLQVKTYSLASSFHLSCTSQGFIVALIYTLINSEVQREIFRSFDRWMMRHNTRWQKPNFFYNYINKLDNDRLYSLGYQVRAAPVRYRQAPQFIGIVQYYRCTNRHKCSVSNPSRQDSLTTAAAIAQELSLLNPTQVRRQSVVTLQNSPMCFASS